MIHGIYPPAAGLPIRESRQSLFANNSAIVDRPGYKSDQVAVVGRPVESADVLAALGVNSFFAGKLQVGSRLFNLSLPDFLR